MRKISFMVLFVGIVLMLHAAEHRVFFSLFNKSKSFVKKEMTGTELLRDSVTTLVYKETDNTFIRFKFGSKKICIGYEYRDMKGNAPDRFEKELKFMEDNGWVQMRKKEELNSTVKYRYSKGDVLVNMVCSDSIFVVGTPAVCNW